jgi:lipocalin-like protein
MKTRMLLALAGLTAGLIIPAFSQTTAKDLVGTWTLVSLTLEKDGTKTDLYGPKPQGRLIHDANDHVVVVITRADLPKFAANDRSAGTTEENKAVVQGSLCLLWYRHGG